MDRVVQSLKNKLVFLIPQLNHYPGSIPRPFALAAKPNGFQVSAIEKLRIENLFNIPPANEEKLKFSLGS